MYKISSVKFKSTGSENESYTWANKVLQRDNKRGEWGDKDKRKSERNSERAAYFSQ